MNYEGHRFGVPYTYSGKTARVMRDADQLYIYSADLTRLLAAHDVTWSRYDSFCKDQYALPEQPEEYPSSYNRFTVKGTAASRVFYRLVAQAVRMREQAA